MTRSRRTIREPKYRKHATGQAVVRIAGKDFYLRKYGTAASHEEYGRLIRAWQVEGCPRPWGGPEGDEQSAAG